MGNLIKGYKDPAITNISGNHYIKYDFFENIMRIEELTTGQKLVLIGISRHFAKDYAPFHTQIGEAVGVTRKTVQLAIPRLVELGYISRETFYADGIDQEVSRYIPEEKFLILYSNS